MPNYDTSQKSLFASWLNLLGPSYWHINFLLFPWWHERKSHHHVYNKWVTVWWPRASKLPHVNVKYLVISNWLSCFFSWPLIPITVSGRALNSMAARYGRTNMTTGGLVPCSMIPLQFSEGFLASPSCYKNTSNFCPCWCLNQPYASQASSLQANYHRPIMFLFYFI